MIVLILCIPSRISRLQKTMYLDSLLPNTGIYSITILVKSYSTFVQTQNLPKIALDIFEKP